MHTASFLHIRLPHQATCAYKRFLQSRPLLKSRGQHQIIQTITSSSPTTTYLSARSYAEMDERRENKAELVRSPPQSPRMGSLSRRACYKCGNVGHYAEVCSSSERLCYNCKQPGHESNGCPLPRTTDSKSKTLKPCAGTDVDQLSSATIVKDSVTSRLTVLLFV